MGSIPDDLLRRLGDLIAPLPDAGGGAAVIAVVDSSPPAMALLTNGGVSVREGRLVLAVTAGSSLATAQPRSSATVLVADEVAVLRVEVCPLDTTLTGDVAVLSGPISAIRPSLELPWRLVLRFEPTGKGDPEAFLEYWRATRRWLEAPEEEGPPQLPG